MKWLIKPTLARNLVALVLLASLWPSLVLADLAKPAGIVTTMTGRATVARTSIPNPLPLQFKDSVFLGDRISTAEDSIVRVLMGGKALVTIRELSVFSITEEAGKSTVDLARGKLSLAVARTRMAPGEVVEVRTPNAVAAVRGTVLVAEVEPALTAQLGGGEGALTSKFTVIKGVVTVATGGASPVTLGAMQQVNVTGQTLGVITTISPGAAMQIIKGMQPPQQITESDSNTKKQISKVEQAKALALAKALVPEALPPEQKEKAPEEKQKEQGKEGEAKEKGKASGVESGGTSSGQSSGDAALADASSPVTQGGGSSGGGAAGIFATGGTGGVPTSTPVTSTTQDPTGGPSGGGGVLTDIASPPPPPSPPGQGPALTIENAIVVVNPGPLATFTDGDMFSGSDPVIAITNSLVDQQDTNPMILVEAEATATVDTSALKATDSSLFTDGSLLSVQGSLSNGTSSPILNLDPTTVGADTLVTVTGSVTTAGPLVSDVGGTLLLDTNVVNVTGGGSVTTTSSAPLLQFSGTSVDVGAISGHNHFFTVNAASDVTLNGPLITATNSNLTVNGFAFLEVFSGGSLSGSGSGSLVSLTGGALTLGLGVRGVAMDSSAATLSGPLLNTTGTTVDAGSSGVPFITLTNSSLMAGGLSSPFIDVNGGSFTLGFGQEAMLLNAATVSVPGSLLKFSNTLVTPGFGSPLVLLFPNSSLTIGGPLLDLTGITFSQGAQPVLAMDSSALTINSGPALRMTGSMFTAGQLASMGGATPNQFVRSGPLLDLTNSTLTLSRLLIFNVADAVSVTLSAGQADIRLMDSNVSMTWPNEALSTLGGSNVSPLTHGGVAIIATNSGGPMETLSLMGPLLRLTNGVTLTDPAAQVQLTNMAVSIGGTAHLIETASGAGTVNVNGPLLTATGSPIAVPADVLRIVDATLTATTAQPLIGLANLSSISPSPGASNNRFLTLDGGSGLTLDGGSLLSLVDSSVTVNGEVLFIRNESSLTTTNTAIPLVSLGNSSIEGAVFDSFFHLESGSTATFAGPLLYANNSMVTDPGPLIYVSQSGVTSTSSLPFVELVNNSTLGLSNGGLALLTDGATMTLAGSLLKTDTASIATGETSFVELTNGGGAPSSLTVGSSVIDLTKATLDLSFGNPSPQYPVVSINEGSTLTVANGPAFKLTDATLVARNLAYVSYGFPEGFPVPSSFNQTGSILDLTRSNAILGSLIFDAGEGGTSISPDIPLAMADTPWVRVEDSNLRFTTLDQFLSDIPACISCTNGFPEDFHGQVLRMTGHSSVVTVNGGLIAVGNNQGSADLQSTRPLVELSGSGAGHSAVLGLASTFEPMMSLFQDIGTVPVRQPVLGADKAAVFLADKGVVVEAGTVLDHLGGTAVFSLNNSLVEFGEAAVAISQDQYPSLGGGQVKLSNGLVSATGSHLAVLASGETAGYFVEIGGQLDSSGTASTTPIVSLNGGSLNTDYIFYASGSGSPAAGIGELTVKGSALAATNGAAVHGTVAGVIGYGEITDALVGSSDTPLASVASGASITGGILEQSGQSSDVSLNRPLLSLNGTGSFANLGYLAYLDNTNLRTDAATQATGFATVRNGGFLNVSSAMVALANGSQVTIENGPLLTVGSGAVVRVAQGASLANFGAGSNNLHFTNPISCGGVCAEILRYDFGEGGPEFGIHNLGGTIQIEPDGVFPAGHNYLFPGFDGDTNTITRFDGEGAVPFGDSHALILVESGGILLLGVADNPDVSRDEYSGPLSSPEKTFSGTGTRYMVSPVVRYAESCCTDIVVPGQDLIRVSSGADHTIFGSVLVTGPGETTLGGVGSDALASLLRVEGRLAGKGSVTLIDLTNATIRAARGVAVESGGLLALNGPLLTSDYNVGFNLTDALLKVGAGGQLIVQGTQDALLHLSGGPPGSPETVSTIGTNLVELSGNAGNTETITTPDYTMTVATDQPIKHQGSLMELGGCGDCYSLNLQVDKLVQVDAALLEASKPIAELLSMTLAAATGVVSLDNKARVTSLGPNSPFFALRNGTIANVNGPFLTLAQASLLQVLGDFLLLSNSSQLLMNSVNGFLARISGNSVLDIHGALVNFEGASNILRVSNSKVPTHTIGGLEFWLAPEVLPSNIIVEGTPIKNPGLGTIERPNGGSLFEVTGSSTKVIIRGR